MATRLDFLKNYIDSLRKIRRHKNYLYNLQILGLTCFPNDTEHKALIFRIQGDLFQYIRYDFKQESNLPIKINFSEKRKSFKKYSINNEIKRTLRYTYKYVRKHNLESLVYPKGHPLTVLTPIMLSVGDDVEIIRNVLTNNIHPYTLARLVNEGYDRSVVADLTSSLTDSLINKTYL